MDCEEIKKIIPRYFNHTANEDEIKTVEEHLCVCHDCRATLGELMDKLTVTEEATPEPKETPLQPEPKAEEKAPQPEPKAEEETPLQPEPKPEEEAPIAEPKSQEAPQPAEDQKMEYIPEKEETLASPEPELPEIKSDDQIDNQEDIQAESQTVDSSQPEPAEESEDLIPSSQEAPQPEETLESEPESQKDALEAIEEEEQVSSKYSLDNVPLNKTTVGPIEYAALIIGVIIFLAVLFLRLKG